MGPDCLLIADADAVVDTGTTVRDPNPSFFLLFLPLLLGLLLGLLLFMLLLLLPLPPLLRLLWLLSSMYWGLGGRRRRRRLRRRRRSLFRRRLRLYAALLGFF